jgi:hypothetical protein
MYPETFLQHIEQHVCEAGVCQIGSPALLAAAAD